MLPLILKRKAMRTYVMTRYSRVFRATDEHSWSAVGACLATITGRCLYHDKTCGKGCDGCWVNRKNRFYL
ncbi:hypothetical protein L596_001597 [Steinernema carpocapsae]|uniref:Uncharacterized protein n=1 Tax=Steinernema carpocapsae TaxID=34508 RepID=A0A4U8ULI1_STECR|nr:hypothetical protein L596_001597 [Steinernema carpocapsae]